MDAHGNPVIPFHTHWVLMHQPPGSYGISYDIYTRRTEDNLPAGWNSRRRATYSELANQLQAGDFHRSQYSDWICDGADAIDAYWTMLSLMRIHPPGKLQSTVKGLKLHYIANDAFDVTQQVQLGGIYSSRLQGPTPAGLVPPNLPAVIPPGPQPLPHHTLQSAEAMDVNNWRV
ncbi:hypothetical protein BKA82DRAFT_3965289 [Pisolithus tinctorius]|nr:hypothetical protein BKA82DRAFT_3981205 [Pisolithus tinctorius]KAI6158283.1 hypothetical protein BKA82DRAFT_3965289 [Pisolithus tinctorius]